MVDVGISRSGKKLVVSVVVELNGRSLFLIVIVLLLSLFMLLMMSFLLLLIDFFLLLFGDEPLLLVIVIEFREKEKDSNAVPITISVVSGKASFVPGSPQRGSCFLHHPSEL